jgi:nitrite reductase/ring-hydroxylating ferredoxin subunit
MSRLHDDLFLTARGISRRAAVLTTLGSLAAGTVSAIGLHHLLRPGESETASAVSLVGAHGKWFRVADLATARAQVVLPVMAGAIQGVLVYDRGEFSAVSRICTHMACGLTIDHGAQRLECPCHGARFDWSGRFLIPTGRSGPHLPNLPPLQVRVVDQFVEVLGV